LVDGGGSFAQNMNRVINSTSKFWEENKVPQWGLKNALYKGPKINLNDKGLNILGL
jgi:hypothetical protein